MDTPQEPDSSIKDTIDNAKSSMWQFKIHLHSKLIIFWGYVRRLERFDSSFFKILGFVSAMLGVVLLLMSLYAMCAGENFMSFLAPAPLFLIAGIALYVIFRFSSLSAATGILLITLAWMLSFIVAIIPFYSSGMNLIDSIYEGISCFTTTGSTLFTPDMYHTMPSSIILWRSVTEWIGGITVVIIFAYLLPMIGMGAKNMASNELGSNDSEFSENVRSSAFSFVKIYLLLTIAETVILLFFWMVGIDHEKLAPFNCICIAMSNVSTGGLLPFSEGMGCMSFPTQFVTLVFMILSISNIFLMLKSVATRRFELGRSKEWRTMIMWFITCAVVIIIVLIYTNRATDGALETVWESIYNVVSAATTGFALSDYTNWPAAILVIILLVQFVGGCSGSAAAGIKIYRLMAIKSFIIAGMDKIMHPGAVTVMEVDGAKMSSDQATSVLSTVMLFILATVVGVFLLLLIDGGSLLNAIMLSVSAISNAGVGAGTGSIPEPSALSKIVLCFMMYLGRMEMVFVLMLFTRRFWSEVAAGTKRQYGLLRQINGRR